VTCTGTAPAAACEPLWARPAMRGASPDAWRPGGLELTDRAAALAGVKPGWRVLDAGCGTGASALHLRRRYGALAAGMDMLAGRHRQGDVPCRVATGVPMVRADAMQPPFIPESFHMILCECVLSLLPDPARALHIFRNLLRSGGTLAVTDLYLTGQKKHTLPAGSCLGWQATRSGILTMLRQAGFLPLCFEDHTPMLGTLAARLVLAGEPLCSLSAAAAGRSANIPHTGTGAGYFLLLARRSG